ncbi:MAG: hypothetical protein ACO2OR_06560 [Desulfurococcaceae archaeon]
MRAKSTSTVKWRLTSGMPCTLPRTPSRKEIRASRPSSIHA